MIDAGSPCSSVASGTTGQFAFYSANGAAFTAHTLAAGDIPALNYQAPLTFTGNGTKTASSTGTVMPAIAPCGTQRQRGRCRSGHAVREAEAASPAPSSTTVGNIPQFSNTTGTAVSAGLGVVTTVGTPGANTNVPTEEAVRTAIAAAVTASGSLPVSNRECRLFDHQWIGRGLG